MIIGAGVMGLTTALQLSERGYKVTVLEKADSVASVSALRLVFTSGDNHMKENQFNIEKTN